MQSFSKITIIIILLTGILLSLIFNPYKQINIENLKIKVEEQKYLIARIYTPEINNKKIPNVIVTHGVNNSKEQMNNLSLNIAHGGMRAITFDFGNFGESYHSGNYLTIADLELNTLNDTEKVIDFLQTNFPFFQFNTLGIIGHSMGGATTLNISEKFPNINSSVVISMGGYADQNSHQNLLFTVGIYEQLNPLNKIFNALNDTLTHKCNLVNNVCGNFQDNNAYKIFISGTTDHIIAPYDYQFNREIVSWLQKSFNLPLTTSELKINLFILGNFFIFVSFINIHITQLIKISKIPQLSRYLSKINIIIIIISIYLVNLTKTNTNLASILIMYLITVTLLSDYIFVNIRINKAKVFKTLIYLFLLLNTALVSTLIFGIFVLINYPQYLWQLPSFILQWWFFIPYNYILNFKLLLFPKYSFYLQASWLFWLLIICEFIKQGCILQGIEFVITKLSNWLNQPFNFRIVMSVRELIILTLLVILSIFLLYQGINNNIIKSIFSLGFEVIRLFLIMILLPSILGILIIKNRWLNRKINYITGLSPR